MESVEKWSSWSPKTSSRNGAVKPQHGKAGKAGGLVSRSFVFPRFPRFPGCSKSILEPGSSGLFLVSRSSIFPRFPGWLFGPSQHPPGNPGKRGNGGSDLRGIEALGAAARTVPSVVAPSAQRSAEHLGRTFGRTFRQLTPPAPVVARRLPASVLTGVLTAVLTAILTHPLGSGVRA